MTRPAPPDRSAQCPQCGGPMQPAPGGGWLCPNCGAQRTGAHHTATSPGRDTPADAGMPYYTTTLCPQCGAVIDGLDHRYVCTLCDWVSPPADQPPVQQPQ